MSSDPSSDAPSGDSSEGHRRGGGDRHRRRRGGAVRGRVRGRGRRRGNDRRRDGSGPEIDEGEQRKDVVLTGDPVEVNGVLELAPKGFGFLRQPDKDFKESQKFPFTCIFKPLEQIKFFKNNDEKRRFSQWIEW